MLVQGAGPPLILIHGLGCSSAYFGPLQSRLAANFTVYAPDLPGHGRSAKPQDRMWKLAELTDWLCALSEQLGLPQPLVVGHSLGGGIAVDLAARYPDLASGIVLLAPTGAPEMPALIRQLPRMMLDAIREPLRLYPLIVPAYLRAGPRRILRLAVDQTRYGQRQALGKIRAPMLVMRGSRDPIDDATAMDELVALATGAERIEVSGAAHALHVSHTARVSEAIVAFARRLRHPF